MFRYKTVPLAALIVFGGVIAVSAAPREVIQNEKGTFIQDTKGAWHQYSRVKPQPTSPPVAEKPADQGKGSIY
jgi:hypothetical protein